MPACDRRAREIWHLPPEIVPGNNPLAFANSAKSGKFSQGFDVTIFEEPSAAPKSSHSRTLNLRKCRENPRREAFPETSASQLSKNSPTQTAREIKLIEFPARSVLQIHRECRGRRAILSISRRCPAFRIVHNMNWHEAENPFDHSAPEPQYSLQSRSSRLSLAKKFDILGCFSRARNYRQHCSTLDRKDNKRL